ncbi:MAG: hypothetical protein GF421_01995 [Candidatus Aminicenantes bacterium]|nr:hypothetical protein [Candidatus Aminicenantes bacterium]
MKSDIKGLKIDQVSFQIGMINCFMEMVACGVKRLAISPPLQPEDYEAIENASDILVKEFKVKSYLEKSLMITALQSEEFTKGKWSILYYKDDIVLKSYLSLKKKKAELVREGKYDRNAQKQISREFMRLLSYPETVIEEKLAQKYPSSPYMLGSDK